MPQSSFSVQDMSEITYSKYAPGQGVLWNSCLWCHHFLMLSFFRYFLPVARIKGNALKVHCLRRSCSQYILTLKDIAHGRKSKYQGLLISELLFPGVSWEFSLQIMSFVGILGGVRICSGWGFLNIKNVGTKHDYLISSLSQALSNMATPHIAV